MEEFHDSADDEYFSRRKMRDRRCSLFVGVIIGVAAFIIGLLIGRFAACPAGDTVPSDEEGVYLPNVPVTLMKDADPTISKELIHGMKPENIRKNLK